MASANAESGIATQITAPRDLDSSITAALAQVIERIPGLKGIAVSNPYGLSVIKVTTTDAPRAEIEGVETLLASVFALAAGQAEKLQFGKTRSIVSFVDGLVVVQCALYPVVMALVGGEEANVGLMMGALGPLQELFSGLQRKAEVYETQEAAE